MATPQETQQILQEIANRGLIDSIPVSKRPLFDEAVRRGLISVPEPVEPIERTITGRVGEVFRGIPRGAVGLLETAAVGASALLPEELETSARERIASIGEAAAAPFQPKPGYEDSISAQFGEAAGSFVPFLAAGPFGLAGRVAATGLGAGAGAGTARERAEQGDATPEERAMATGLGSLVGLSEVVVPFRILGNAIGNVPAQGVLNRLRRAAQAGGEEGLQEAAAEVAQNLIERGVYNPEQGAFVGTGESFGYGAGVGGLAQGLFDLFAPGRDRGVSAPPAAEQAAETEITPAVTAEPLRTVSVPLIMTGGGANGVMRVVQEPSGRLFGELVDPTGNVRMRQPIQAASPNAFLDEMGKLEKAGQPVNMETFVAAINRAALIKRPPEQQDLFSAEEAPVSGKAPIPSLTGEEIDAAAPARVAPTRRELEAAGQTDLVTQLQRLQAEDSALAAEQRQRGDLFPGELEAATSDESTVARAMARSQAREDESIAAMDADVEAVESQDQEQLDMLGFDEVVDTTPSPPPPPTPAAATPTPTPPSTPPSTPPPPPTTPMQFGSEKAANAAARQIATELGVDISDADLAALVKPTIRFALPSREPAIRKALQKMVQAAPAATAPAATTPAATTPTPTEVTTPTSTLSAADFDRAVNSRIDRLSNSVVRELLRDNDIDFVTGKEKERLREFKPVEKAILANQVLDDDLQIELPGKFEEKTSFSMSGAGSTTEADLQRLIDQVPSYHMDEWTKDAGLSPETVAKYWQLSTNQRDVPERRMVQAQKVTGGGVINPAIEHIGDITDRMGPRHSLGFSYEESKGKAEKYLRSLRSGYGFRREHEENLRSNAEYLNIPLEEHTAKVNAALDAYADAHAALKTYNPLQTLARDTAVALGRREFEKAATLLEQFVARIPTKEAFIKEIQPTTAGSSQINQALGAGSYSTDLFPYISDFNSALDAIVKYASNPAQREIAQKLAARIPQLEQLGFKFSLKVTQDGYQITGGASGVSRIRHYQLGANTSIEITLNHPSNGVNSGTGWVTVAHEIAHAATQAQLTYAPQGTAAVQLRALFNDVVSHFNERVKQGNLTAFEKNIYQNKNNALGNPDELLAWGLTDPEMQQWLDSIKSKNGSFLSRLFDIVASALGFSKNDTAFSELLSISDNLLTESFVPYIEAANARGKSFGRQENLTNHPTWALWAAEARPIVWSAPDAALIEAETLSGNTIYILATPQGTTQVDVSKYTGKMLPPARLKLIQKIAAGLTKTNPSMNKTAQVAEEVIFNDTPQSNSLFLKTQGAQLNSTSKPMRSKPVRDAVANIMGTTSGSSAADAARAVLTWGLPLPALNDYVQSYMRKKGPAYELFADAMQRFTDTAVRYEGALREFTDSITAQIARMGEWKTNNPELYDAMTNLYFGASHAKVDLTKPESEYAGNPEKLSAYKRLKKDFIAIGGSGQAIYRQMRAIHNRQFKQISQQVFDRVYADTKDKGMATRVRDAFVEQMRAKGPLEGYAPMLRPSGKHMLKYVIKGEDAFEIFTNPNDREARKQQLIADGVSEKDIKSFLGDKLSNFDGIVPSSFLGQLVGTLKEVKVDDATRDALIESVMTLGVAMSPPNSVLERLASRKEVAGYVRDPFWAFQEGTMGLGRKLINMQYGARMNNELRNMQETRKNIGDDPIAASILNDVAKRATYASNPSQAWWSNAFTTATYGWTLGFNVSSAIVDLSSLVLVTGPYLTRTYGWAKTHRAMMQSAKEIMGMGTSADVETLVTQGLEGAELQEVLKTMGTKERDMVRRKTSPSMLNINFNDPVQAKKYGYLKPLVDKVRESGHSERYSELSESAEFGESNLLSKWSARMGFMMNASERFKREVGIKAAYDLELSKIGANPTPEQMAAAAQKAMETSLLLNGGSTAVTGARFQQNDIFRIAFMYRRFAALQMYLQAKTAYDSTLNDDPAVKAAARQFAAYTMLTSAAFVGVKGMPMMGTVAALWAMFGAVFGEEDEDNSLDNFLRTNLDPILVEGIPNILFNANVAGRMEMTNLLIRDSNLPNDATLADGIAAHFGGPTYGSISRAIKGAGMIADGEIQRGVENMLPVSISNIFKSGRFLAEGAIETLRDDVVVEVNPFGAMAQALGFAPADYARAMDFNIGQSNAERRISDRRTGLYEAVYTAYRVGDTDGVAQAMQAIIEFNQRYPEFAITSQGLRQSISGRDRNTQNMVMGRLPSARTRGVTLETAEDWGF